MATLVADTACIDPRSELDDDVEIGPYCIVGPEVKIGRGTRLIAHVCIRGLTTLGERNVIHPFAVIGGEPQDVSFRGSATRVVIGDLNVIREGVTIHRGSEKEQGLTRIGSNNLLMVNVHVAHDCVLDDKVVIANNTILGGHGHVESYATISGGVGIHPFVTIGSYSYVGGLSRIYHDVPPFMMIDGNPSKVRCINVVGLRRHGISAEAISGLHEAHRLIYRARMTVTHASEILESHGHICTEVRRLLEFIETQHLGKHGRAQGALENDMTRLRIAVVGVGHLGQHHARILAAMPRVDLVAVVDARLEQAEAVAARCGTVALHDYRPLLDSVDAVTIAVPTFLHREVAGAFLERGIATLVEKPMASSAAESEELVEQARAGALLQVGHIERFNPALRALDQLPIRPKYISAERLSTYTFRSTDIGVVLDLMIHDLDLLLSLIQAPVRSVAAVGVSLFGEHEDVANARIEFEDGSVASLTASRASYTPTRKMHIWGAEGYASLDFAAMQATTVRPSEQLKSGRLDLDGVDLSQPVAVREHLFGKVLRVDRVPAEPANPLALELDNFVDAARGLSPPRVSGEDALRAIRLADQVLRSLEAHRWNAEPTAATTFPSTTEAVSFLQGPHALRIRSLRQASRPAGH